jgi:transcriptional regulator with XRE-family HTH domain
MQVGTIIRLLRTTEGVSQTTLAEELGVARTYLSQVENNKVEPGLTLLKSVSQQFDIPLSLLVISHCNENQEIFVELRRLLGELLSARLVLKRG